MKSEIYVIGYRLGVRLSLQSLSIVTACNRFSFGPSASTYVNFWIFFSDAIFSLSAVSCLKQWYVRLQSRPITLIQSRLSFACFKIKITNQYSILFKKGAKRIYILMIKVDKFFSFFSSRCFLKEIENMSSLCFFRVIETLVKVWENSKKLLKHLHVGNVLVTEARVPAAFLVLLTGASTCVSSKQLDYELEISITHRIESE